MQTFVLFPLVLMGVLALTLARGFRDALRLAWLPILLLGPVWLTEKKFFSVVIDLRSMAGWAILLGLLLALRRERNKFLLLDFFLLLVISSICISKYLANEVRMLTIPEVLRQWLLPYLMGRWLFSSSRDIDPTLRILAPLMAILTCWNVFEAVTRFEIPGAPSNYALNRDEWFRWGLKRASGPLTHPISMGLFLGMLLPWALLAAQRTLVGRGPAWWKLLPAMAFIATVVTVSRGSMMGAMIAIYLTLVLRSKRWRVPVLALTTVVGLSLWASKDTLIPMMTRLIRSEEKQREDPYIFEYKNQQYEYTGDKHRILLWIVYADAIAETGWFGLGGDAVAIIMKTWDESVPKQFASIDSHYLLFFLENGWLGLLSFLGMLACVLWYLFRLAWDLDSPTSMLAAGMFGSMLATGIVMWSVFFDMGYGQMWLFTSAMAANLRCLPAAEATPTPGIAAPKRTRAEPGGLQILRPRLVSGSSPAP